MFIKIQKVLIKLLTTLENHDNAENENEAEFSFDINQNELLPLKLLFNEDYDRVKLETFIEHLKIGNNFDKSILVYGPAKSGKFNLAYSVANLTNLPFIAVDASSLIDPEMFNRKDGANDEENKCNKNSNLLPINVLFDQVKDKLPAVFFIRLLDSTILGIDCQMSQKLRINFILSEIVKYKQNNKVLFIISSYIPYSSYPKNTDFSGLNGTIVKFELPDYNRRGKLIKHNFDIYKEGYIEIYKRAR